VSSTPVSLLERLRSPGDTAAWERFVHIYTPLLHRWLQRAGASPDAAADLLQDVFVRLLGLLPTFRRDPGGSFRAWLHALVLNRWRDHCRKRRPVGLPDGEGLTDPAAGAPDEVCAAEEHRAYVLGRVLGLVRRDYPAPTWQGFWRTVVEGEPVAQVARDLGLTPNALYLARGRILRRLREELAGLLD
jgi:RNA polymerase sigma-70 factor (ECF subfamily)